MPVLSLDCHLPHNTPHIPSRYNNEQTTKRTKAINNSYIYIYISHVNVTQTVPDISPLMPMHQNPLLVLLMSSLLSLCVDKTAWSMNWLLGPCGDDFISGNIKTHLHFLSFLHTKMVTIVEIPHCGRQNIIFINSQYHDGSWWPGKARRGARASATMVLT